MAKEKLPLEQLLILAREIPKADWEYYYLYSGAASSRRVGSREVFRKKNHLCVIGDYDYYSDLDYRGFIGRNDHGTIKIIQYLKNRFTLYGGDVYPYDEIEAKGSSGGDEFLLSADLKQKHYPTKRFVSPKTTDSKLYWADRVNDNYLDLERKFEKEYKQVQRLFQIPYQIFLKKSLQDACPMCKDVFEEHRNNKTGELIPIPLGGIDY